MIDLKSPLDQSNGDNVEHISKANVDEYTVFLCLMPTSQQVPHRDKPSVPIALDSR